MALLAAHWRWIGYAFVALALVLLVLALRHWRQTAGGGYHLPPPRPPRAGDALARAGSRVDEREFSAAVTRPAAPRVEPARGSGSGSGWAQARPAAAEPAVLGLENQIDGLQDTLVRRVDALERRIEKVENQLELEPGVEDLAWRASDRPVAPEWRGGALPQHEGGGGVPADSLLRDTPPPPSVPGGAWDRGFGRAGEDPVVSRPIVPAAGAGTGGGPAMAPGGGVGVEIRGSEVVASQSYPPEAYLTVRGGGVASVVLNPEVPHNSFALDRFALFFELGERREGMYQTQTPAEVKWDGERGTLRTPGRAVAR